MKTELINFKQKMLDVNLTTKEKKAIEAIPTPQNIYKKINFKNFK